MDANGLKFWMLSEKSDWRLDAASGVSFDSTRRHLRLASARAFQPVTEVKNDARSLLEKIPQTLDSFGARAYFNTTRNAVMVGSDFPGEIEIFKPEDGESPSDLAMGYDGALYLAFEMAKKIVMLDQRDRWDAFTLSTGEFSPWRLAADPGGGVWVLDRSHRRLARFHGQPLPRNSLGIFAADTFRPDEENPDPPRLSLCEDAFWPPGEEAVAIALNAQGRLALLSWPPDDQMDGLARVRRLGPGGEFEPAIELEGSRFPYSLAWVSEDRIAALLTGLNSEAPVYAIGDVTHGGGGRMIVPPVGDIYPLRDYESGAGPFLRVVAGPPRYPKRSGSTPLHRLSLPSYLKEGRVSGSKPSREGDQTPAAFDSGSDQTVWHRLYLEASIPPKCGVVVRLAAASTPDEIIKDEDWSSHLFGEHFEQNGNLPRGVWAPVPSELPFHPGMLACKRERNSAGLFTALIQRAGRRVRTLRGRYLYVEVELIGDGRSTPEVAALRAYASRFSYVNRYLPEIYHETEFGPDADRIVSVDPATGRYGPTTPADFLERFVDNFEGLLTPLEDRIANAHLLTDPDAAPEEALEWLASWIGMSFDPVYRAASRRESLRNAAKLYRYRGTENGLKLALDIATGGGVSGGEIIVLEDFRLRRALATILGANLENEDDPLLGGVSASSNSFVGDTLVLGEEEKKEFLALFDAELLNDPAITRARLAREEAAVAAFFDRLAHRVTVLVHQEIEPQDLGLIRRVVEMETPAHIFSRVVTASFPFLVGVASLIGVDTYLGRRPHPRPVRVGQSRIGRSDFLLHPPSLDPRLKGGIKTGASIVTDPPVADDGP
jgi:phage tail-like protein